MPMDELIRGIEQMGTENMQDLLDAVTRRFRQLYPGYSLLILSLPENDPEERKKQLDSAWKLIQQTQQ